MMYPEKNTILQATLPQVKNIYRRDQKFWARRPLTRDMICYAAADVLALVPTIYNAMARLTKQIISLQREIKNRF